MTRAECEQLIAAYLKWLREGIRISETESGCHIATPFLDRHNDEVEIYVEKRNGSLLLTDDGYTINDLAASGMTFSTEKRQAHLSSILNGFGVALQGDELQVIATHQDFAQKKHRLVQAILSINDMFVMGHEHVFSLFKEDVAAFMESHAVAYFPDIKLTGRSGFDHKFDFGLPKTRTKPERVVQAVNNLTKDQALSIAFAVADVRSMRADSVQALAFLNDISQPVNDENIAALRAYDITPVRWSRRDDSLSLLNGVTSIDER
jgi:hypothetical protein